MDRDKLDKKLSERFQSIEMAPDGDMWSRIEKTLDTPATVVTKPRRRLIPIISSVGIAAAVLLSFILLQDNAPMDVEVAELPQIITTTQSVADNVVATVASDKVLVAQAVEPKSNVVGVAKRNIIRTPAVVEKIAEERKEVPARDENPVREEETVRGSNTQAKTRSAVTANSNELRYNEDAKKSKKYGDITLSVSGSGSAGSSSSVMDNSNTIRPVRGINPNFNILGLYSPKIENRKWRHNMPISFSFTAQKMFSRHFGIETGLTYTYLSSDSEGETILDQDIKQQLHYVGIPVSFVYRFAESGALGFYTKVGFLVDKAVSATSRSYFEDKSQALNVDTGGVQFSSQLQVGASYDITKNLSFYIEPSVSYYFKSSQPVSYRTDNNFGFSFNLGMRFKL